MHPFTVRAAAAALVSSGLATLALGLSAAGEGGLAAQQLRLMSIALGAALLLASAMPAARLPVLAAGLLFKLSFLLAWLASGGGARPAWVAGGEAVLMAVLGAAAFIFARAARQEARWDRGLPLET